MSVGEFLRREKVFRFLCAEEVKSLLFFFFHFSPLGSVVLSRGDKMNGSDGYGFDR